MATRANESRKCRFCGATFVNTFTPTSGRPRDFCCKQCRHTESLLVWLEANIGSISGESMTLDAAAALRGRLWSMANMVNVVGRPQRRSNV